MGAYPVRRYRRPRPLFPSSEPPPRLDTELENLVEFGVRARGLGIAEDYTHRIPFLREFLVDMLHGLQAQLRPFEGFDQAAGKMLVVPSNLTLTMLLVGIG